MKALIEYAMSWLGTPYEWGGDGRGGIDCSGFVQEVLASVGLDPIGDQTAHGLFEYFSIRGKHLEKPEQGALVFYGSERKTHVAFAIDSFRVIEAGGGGSKTLTFEDAIKHNAWVRIRPYNHRKDNIIILKPSYDFFT